MRYPDSNGYFYHVDNEWFRGRLFGLMMVVFAVFAILALRLFYLQIIQGDHFFKLSKNNCIRIQRIKPVRGLIFDCNGELLVENRPSFDLCIVPADARPVKKTLDQLLNCIPEFSEEITRKIARNKIKYGYQPQLLKQDIGRNALAVVSARRLEMPGISIDINARRNYVHDALASHLIGYLGEISAAELQNGHFRYKESGDYIGRYGIEKTFDAQLSGVPGGRIVQMNAMGQLVSVLDTVAAAPGNNIYLTIDYRLQSLAETLLEDQAGAIVAMDPGSGEILAMASNPGFSQNGFINGICTADWQALLSDPDRPMMNKAVSGEYPPASTYKVVTAIAALEEGLIDEHTTFYCPGSYQYGNRSYGCWKKEGHGKLNIIEALSQSCDVYFYQVGRKLGVDRLAWYATACGLGKPTGINLDMEAGGLVPTAAWKKNRIGISWQGGENLSIAIGQGYNLITPLQLTVLYGALANGGTVFRPLVYKTVQTAGGQTVCTRHPEVIGKLPVSAKTLSLVQQGLHSVVNDRHGTGRWYVYDKTVDISGKTGTAQVVSRKTEQEAKKKKPSSGSVSYDSHAWFVGYAPSADPEIVVSVLIEHGKHGSSGAGPAAREMMVSYLKNKAGKAPAASDK